MSIQESGFICSAVPCLLAEGWPGQQGLLGLSLPCLTPPVPPEPCRGFQSCCSESCCVVCSKSCLWGSSEQPTGRGNAFSSKIAAARDGLSASCKKHILQKAAEILWRQWTKEIPAAGSKGCLRNSSCFPGDSLSEGRLFSGIFPVPF